MIETIENAFQVLVLIICCIICMLQAIKRRDRSLTLLFFFYGSYLLGDLYWQICLFYYKETPEVKWVSDMSWYGAFLFLYLLMKLEEQNVFGENILPLKKRHTPAKLWPYLSFVFTFGMGFFYMQLGDVISNIIYAIIMGLALSRCFIAFADTKDAKLLNTHSVRRLRQMAAVLLLFCILEYTMWTASCFWDETKIPEIIYYTFDVLMSLSFPLALVGLCIDKAAGQETGNTDKT